ncbi:hypothetical protein JRO89_XSUnG0141200 [Xanthoceras sorbifolium]|uniref:Sey1/RHD3-like three-helix bundle domain-containing protein n=1 Tax=Xanthoceras sorbifolium TaxID=99658 RepID=A0ABQ8GY29_9ROSI|nr:hypothetical protein JRO89_XSUnG0141200 [Xanthoceras sorbifolium]
MDLHLRLSHLFFYKKNDNHIYLNIFFVQFVHPLYGAMLGHLRSKAFESFKIRLEQLLNKGEGVAASVRNCTQSCMLEFDQGCADAAIRQANWDASKVRTKLSHDIDAHASSVRSAKLTEIIANYEKELAEALIVPVESLFEVGSKDTWASIRRLLKRESKAAVLDFTTAIAGFELDQSTVDTMVENLRSFARNVVRKKAREEAGKVLIRMKERFSAVFNHDNDSMPRVWTGKEDIRKIMRDAHSASLRLLSVMAAIRLDEKPDKIENVLFSSLIDGTLTVSSSGDRSIGTSADPLASSTWEEVSPKETLITPVQCKSLWRQFKAETEYTVTQAVSAQLAELEPWKFGIVEEAHKRSNNWLPPPWAIVAMAVLGFNEFMLLLKNPLYLMVLFIAYLLSKALWVQMNISGEFRHGTVSTKEILVSSGWPNLHFVKVSPTVMNLLRRLAEEAQGGPKPEAPRPPQSLATQSFKYQSQSSSTTTVPESSVSSNISSSDNGLEYSSPNLTHRRSMKSEEAEVS